jgi:hypothetical protein
LISCHNPEGIKDFIFGQNKIQIATLMSFESQNEHKEMDYCNNERRLETNQKL